MLAAKNADICSKCLMTEPCVRSFILPIFVSGRGYVSRKNSVAVCRLVAATAVVGLMLPRAVRESEEELRQTRASASFVDEG